MTTLKTILIDRLNIFYRQAGDPKNPAILLLHGFPTSSHQYRNLIPLLAERYFVIAPDLPGFGFSDAPAPKEFSYTLDRLAEVMERFLEAVEVSKYTLYIFDYGSPVGLRLALKHPERVTAIISQNGNAYEEGLSDAWQPMRAYWNDPSAANREALRGLLTFETTKFQYTHGTPETVVVAPEAFSLDQFLLDRPGNSEIQLDLFLDYQNNVRLYPKFQEYFRVSQPPLLALWGKHDPFFLPEGAKAFERDNTNATYTLFDTGHFALETHCLPIATHILRFLDGLTAKDFLGVHPSPRSTVEMFYRLLLDNDSSGALALLSPEVQWIGAAGFPYTGVYTSRDEVVSGVFSQLSKDWTSFELQPTHLSDSGEEVTALGYYSGLHARTGKKMKARFSHIFRVRHGLIVQFEQVSDTHKLREAMD